jgi:hypothetical protein
VLGAPFPVLPDRKRQDAPTAAMIFLDENGHDRLTLGESPNPQVNGKIGARTALAFGLLIHDQTGAERGGFAWLASGRAVIALDRPSQDGWTATVDDETGFAGMVALYSPDVAARNSSGIVIGTQGDSAFLRLKDTKDADPCCSLVSTTAWAMALARRRNPHRSSRPNLTSSFPIVSLRS